MKQTAPSSHGDGRRQVKIDNPLIQALDYVISDKRLKSISLQHYSSIQSR